MDASAGRPIFISLADQIADDILAGLYPEDSQVPSTNELAAHYRINPATAGKALNRLADQGLLYKRRGLGMFVAVGAQHAERERRLADFASERLIPVLEEGERLGLSAEDIVSLIRKEASP